MTDPDFEQRIDKAYLTWFAGLTKNNGSPDWGPICTGLIIIEKLKNDSYNLDINYFTTDNGAQIKGQGNPLAKKILENFGEERKLPRGEFGRTNRSSVPTARRLLEVLKPLELELLPKSERDEILTSLQQRLLPYLQNYLIGEQINSNYSTTLSTEHYIRKLLEQASKKTSGTIAQHLVGAKLQLRYPELKVSNHPASAADAPTARSGDFHLGNTVFHVTVTPQDAVFDKCIENLNENYRVYLLVSEKSLPATIKKAQEKNIANRVVIKSIESFIGQNIDELAQFSTEQLLIELNKLLTLYNKRIKEVERSPLVILIPEQLSLADDPIIMEQAADNSDDK